MKKGTPKLVLTPNSFKIVLTIGDRVFKSEGATAPEALASLEKPMKIAQKATLRISDGTKSNQILMSPTRVKRLFMSRGHQIIQMKTLAMGMK